MTTNPMAAHDPAAAFWRAAFGRKRETPGLRVALQAAVHASGAPGAVAYAGDLFQTYLHEACGLRQRHPEEKPAQEDTPYDLASLTKVIATTTAIMLLREDGALDLDQPAGDILPVPEFNRFTLRQLITHTAGLQSGPRKHFEPGTDINAALLQIAAMPPKSPPGAHYCYSDLGFMILRKVVELAGRDSFGDFCARRIFRPLEMDDTGFNPSAKDRERCAFTENCEWRKRLICGEVHDENAWALGGISGHAGLFSTAGDLARFCRGLLSGKIVPEKVLEEMTSLNQTPVFPWQGLGWRVDPWASGNEGYLPGRTAFGHTGWTGTCLWAHRASGTFAILLSNTCHPSRAKRDNRTLRRTFFAAAATELMPKYHNTHAGLDRLLWDYCDRLHGKRLGILTHSAAVDQIGRFILDGFALDDDVQVTRLFSPEHGLQGQAEAGANVSSDKYSTQRWGDVPVVSLYGGRKAPEKADLEGLDLFVVDLQDVGSRYYTYPATMKACLKACAAAKVPVLVLDRPNPVGGAVLEGPIATHTDSLVCCAPVPVRHGMTLGEMADFFAKTELQGIGLRLDVSDLDNWDREMLFDETPLMWRPPSPNMPTSETALAYVGTCLFEGTNLNEGRGTDSPFLLVGAPWLDSGNVLADLDTDDWAGLEIAGEEYTPRAIPGRAATPRYRDELCRGIRLRVKDGHMARPFRLAVALLAAIRKLHADKFAWEKSFDILAGGHELRQKIDNGARGRDIVAWCEPMLAEFDGIRPRRYPPGEVEKGKLKR